MDPAGAGPTAIVAGNGSDFDADQSRGVHLVPVIGSASLSWHGTVKFKGLIHEKDDPSPDGPLLVYAAEKKPLGGVTAYEHFGRLTTGH